MFNNTEFRFTTKKKNKIIKDLDKLQAFARDNQLADSETLIIKLDQAKENVRRCKTQYDFMQLQASISQLSGQIINGNGFNKTFSNMANKGQNGSKKKKKNKKIKKNKKK